MRVTNRAWRQSSVSAVVALVTFVGATACGGSTISSGADAAGPADAGTTDTGHHSDATSHDSGHEATGLDAAHDSPAPVEAALDVSVTPISDGSKDSPMDSPATADARKADTAPPPPACSPTCPDGNACSAADQCASGVCTAGTCAAPACGPKCADGAHCGANSDCASLTCASAVCAPPTCSPTCADGAACGAAGDCASGVCTNGACASPTCSPTCANAAPCALSTDCASGVCTADECAPPACAPTCPGGNPCGANGDCTSGVCTNGLCTAPAYPVGGTVTGLSGIGLVLDDNGGDALPVATDGSFTFPTAIASGNTYTVSVASQPAGQTCYIPNPTGTIASAAVTSVNVVCRTGLVAYYPFDEGAGTTILDATGNGNDGTHDAVYVPGVSGTALQFSGTTGAIIVGNAAFTWGAANADYTVDYWVQVTAIDPKNWMSPFHKSDVGGGDCCADYERSPAQFFYPNSLDLYVVMATSSDGNYYPANYPQLTLNTWTHFAEVHSGGTMLIYVNGAQVGATASLPSATVGGQGTLYLGNDTFYDGLQGIMDEVRVYDFALTPAEIMADATP